MKACKYLIWYILPALVMTACVKEEYVIATSDDILMGEYFEEESDIFSSFYEILEKSGTLSFLKAYGTYTCFAPTNEAVSAYILDQGKSSIDDFTEEELKTLVRYHVIIDTINSTRFTDGKLPTPTMYGQYLTARAYFEEGHSVFKINKYAEVEHLDIRVANGIIHSIKSVLEPVVVSVAGLIDADPDLSIFAEALKQTGLYDTLDIIPPNDAEHKRWFTVFVHTDSVYRQAGINSYQDLYDRYCNTGDPRNRADSLYLYISYHILDHSLKYVTDLITESAHLTFAPKEVITIRLKGDSVLINEDEFRGVTEPGAPVNRIESDNTAANGVYHFVEKNFYIKIRYPFPIYWDVADQPELRKMVGMWRVPGWFDIELGQLGNITWSTDVPIQYVCAPPGDKQARLIYSDYLQINLRTAVINWVEFTTPLIVKGEYNLWTCTRNVYDPDRRPIFMVYFNGEALPNIIKTDAYLPDGTDEELLLQGYKRYNYEPADSVNLTGGNYYVGQLAGKVNVPTTGTHKVKFVVINNGDKTLWIDMMQFIPVESDQLWPRVDNQGILREKPDWYPLPETE
jgi:uncharacterized surface protein with fasciclin (FAS1) repeats